MFMTASRLIWEDLESFLYSNAKKVAQILQTAKAEGAWTNS